MNDIEYALEKVKTAKAAAKRISVLNDPVARDAAKAEFPGHESAILLGSALGISTYIGFELDSIETTLASARAQVAILERLWIACDKLGIYVPTDGVDSDLPWLEKLVSGDYRSEASDLSEKIAEAISEIRVGEYDKEEQESCDAMKAAGFVFDEETEVWQRGGETVVIESQHNGPDWWYRFGYDHPDGTRVSGKSGEFSNLLDAIKGSEKEE